jgi:hypothetical protein
LKRARRRGNRAAVRNEPGQDHGRSAWWDTRWCAVVLVLLAAVPLLYPPVPPLTDLPSHIGRYRIQLEYAQWPVFREHFTLHRALIGNLGVDLLVYPLAPLLGLEGAVKAVVLAIPSLLAAGFLWTAREVHGRVPPTALFALPLAYGFPFHYGFVNFSLSMALAFCLFPLWLRLGRTGRWRLRAAVFLPASLILWLCHTFGWAVLGVLAFSAEFVRYEGTRGKWVSAGFEAGLACLPLAPPALAMIAWRLAGSSQGSKTEDFFEWRIKLEYWVMILRDRWIRFDQACAAVLVALFGYTLISRKWRLAPELGIASLILLACFVIVPARVFGAAFADMRLVPYTAAAALLAIRPAPEADRRGVRALAAIGLAFLLVRTMATTASLGLYSQAFDRELAAVAHIRPGSRVVALIGAKCGAEWQMRRLEHLSGLAIARQRVFANDQWREPGAQWIQPDYPEAGRYASDPSQIVRLTPCLHSRTWRTLDDNLRELPRQAFDYLWLIDPPAYHPALLGEVTPVWREGRSALFRIEHRTANGPA